MQLDGIFLPVPTPFLGGRLDLSALRANLARYLGTGVRGIVALGSSGEAPLVDDDESDRVVAAAREVTARHQVLIAGTGRESTRATIEATKRAAREGADAVLVRTPSFFKAQMSGDVFVAHYTAVADASPVPVLLYNVTVFTGVNLLPAAVARLAGHPNIVGMKESGGDIGQVSELVAVTTNDFKLLAGSATTFYAALCAGAVGGVLALACVVPELMVRMVELVRAGRHEDARVLQQQVSLLAKLVTSIHGIAGLKAAVELAGYPCGPPRPPLLPAPAATVEEIGREMALRRARDFGEGGGRVTLPPFPARILLGPGPSLIEPRVMRAMATPVLSHLDPEVLTLLDSIRARSAQLVPGAGGRDRAGHLGHRDFVHGSGDRHARRSGHARHGGHDRLLRGSARRDVPPLWRVGLADFSGVGPCERSRRPEGGAEEDRRRSRRVRARRDVHRCAQPGGGARGRRAGARRAHLVDAVTTLGGHELDMAAWGVDAVYSCSQKCIGAPPGFSPLAVAARARRKKGGCRSYYLDLDLIEEYWVRRKYHHTLSSTLAYALAEAILAVQEEGLERRWQRHERNHLALANGLAAMELMLLPPEGERLWTLNVVKVPTGVDEAAVRRRLREQFNIEIGSGLGPLAGRVWRIGLMGASSVPELVLLLLGALETALIAEGHRLPRGAGVAAAASFLAG